MSYVLYVIKFMCKILTRISSKKEKRKKENEKNKYKSILAACNLHSYIVSLAFVYIKLFRSILIFISKLIYKHVIKRKRSCFWFISFVRMI